MLAYDGLTRTYVVEDDGAVFELRSDGNRKRVHDTLFWSGTPVQATPDTLLDVIDREYVKLSKTDLLKGFGGWR